MSDVVDAIVADGLKPDANVQSENTPNAAELEQEAPENTEQPEPKEDGEQDEGFVPFPKKAKNAIARRDKEIAKLRARLREIESSRTEQQPPQAQAQASSNAKPSDYPKEEDFQTYGDYLKAVTLYEVKQEMANAKKADSEAQQKQQADTQKRQYIEEKSVEVAKRSQEMAKTIPDFAEVIQESAEIADYLPLDIQMAFFEAENAALAFYNLAKEGKLADLANMTPTQAARAIALAEKMPSSKPTQAPRPMPSANGKGKPASSIPTEPDALLQWLKK